MVWNSPNSTYTLQNCMVLPILAAIYAAGNLSNASRTLVEKYQIPKNASLTGTASGWPVINQCTQAFCELSGASAAACTVNSENYSTALYAAGSPVVFEMARQT